VVAFAGSGKTTALRLLAGADSTPALYLAYNKSTQLAAHAHFPAQVACRTMHSLAFRALRMFEQQRRRGGRGAGHPGPGASSAYPAIIRLLFANVYKTYQVQAFTYVRRHMPTFDTACKGMLLLTVDSVNVYCCKR
jgi:hypothetical protein